MTIESDLAATQECSSRTEAGKRFIETFRALQRESGRLVPLRKQLTLPIARSFAAYMSILEVLGPRHAVFRIIGTGHVNRTRIDNTGKNWFDLAEPLSHELHAQHFQRVLNTPCGCVGRYMEKYDRPLIIEAINFPFADADGRARFIVSTTVQLSVEDMLARGDASMVPGEIEAGSYIDIGAGLGQ